MVLGSNPGAGRREPRGFQVDLVVSRGLRPIHIRDWTGAEVDRAVHALRARGLQVDASDHEYSNQIAEGRVISQTPIGQVLHRGDTVSLTVSKGPPLVQIPSDLRTMPVGSARQLLVGLGFHVRVQRTEFYVGLDYVVGSDPDPGSYVTRGSTIILKIV
jgi:serine/threonine-protein kinase